VTELTVPLRTPRLVLRALRPGDAAHILAYRGRADVSRFLTTDPLTADAVDLFVEERRTATRITAHDSRIFLAVQLGDQVIGDVSLSVGKPEHRQGEIGWVYHPRHAGHGYATEAAQEVLRVAFDVFALHRVFAQLDPRNVASARLCVRLGMRQEAHLREESWFKGEWGDLAIYAVLAAEWRDAQGSGTAPGPPAG
jgi:RimJ/RimL family protein N-acetyltransferase